MDEPIADYLDELNAFISNSRDKLRSILCRFNWTEESLFLLSEDEKRGLEDLENEPERSTKPDESLNFDEGSTKEPMDSEKLYNEIMASLPQPTKVKEEVDQDKVIRDQLAAERDAKRRRISYRNKVHTKNKSHTEIMREVIHQQMTAFEDWVSQESGKGSESKGREDKESDGKLAGITDLIDIGDFNGNCHTVWKHVGEILRKRLRAQEEEEMQDYKRRRRRGSSEEPRRKAHSRRDEDHWDRDNRDRNQQRTREHRKKEDKDRRSKEERGQRNREEKESRTREHKKKKKKKDHKKRESSIERTKRDQRKHKSDYYDKEKRYESDD